jgi:sarcosine oxidase subunit gamma
MVDQSWRFVTEGLVVRREPARSIHMLRVRGAEAAQLAALETALGVELPRQPTHALGAAPRVLALAPGDWMLVGAVRSAGALAAAAAPALAHLSEVTDGRVAFGLAGARAGDLLAKGTPVDLHERAFPVDRCAQTHLAQTHVLIDRPGGQDAGFVLYTDISYVAHLTAWFQAAAAEFL